MESEYIAKIKAIEEERDRLKAANLAQTRCFWAISAELGPEHADDLAGLPKAVKGLKVELADTKAYSRKLLDENIDVWNVANAQRIEIGELKAKLTTNVPSKSGLKMKIEPCQNCINKAIKQGIKEGKE